ncbi:hypothetical protein [Micromonospora musae]|uniref:Peptidase MA-like domain-containing protein n=1 Tax=Micromonospora musae TaxID=1894970 RepID=A0A3A9Y3C8_9ACTN|nr:hypothetical protein [Micromonospora musae]RKN31163.1 hypothetical protein D7044_18140 [Micromonospora musae]
MTDGLDEAAPRRIRPLWTVLTLVVLLLITCGVPAAVLTAAIREPGGRAVVQRADPTAGDPARDARDFAARIAAVLNRQSAALLAGDLAGFLAVAEPSAHTDLRRRFNALRALGVTTWRAEVTGLPTAIGDRPGEWRMLVRFQYCFAVPGCRPSPVLAGTRWRDDARQPRLVAVEESKSAETGTRPWEVSELAVATGARTSVATTPALRGKLPALLTQAEAAAKVADRYAVAGSPPDRYRIYYAGPAEWERWYGGGRPKWTGGYAVTVGGGHHEMVINADGATAAGLDDLLRHELTHAASLPEQGYPGRSTWWLVEGLAEYAGAGGQPVSRYQGMAQVRELVRGGWNGRLDDLAPADDAPAARVAGSYGLGYLAVRHLVDRFGEQRLLAFVAAVLHDRTPPEQAAEEAFGEPWSALHGQCVAYIRTLAA